MKRSYSPVIFSTLFIFLSITSVGTYAQEYKIGYVSMMLLLNESPQAKSAAAEIKSEFSSRESQLIKAQQDLKEMESKFASDAAILSESERLKVENDILLQRRKIKRESEEFEEDLSFKRNTMLTNLQREIAKAIKIVAEQEKYDFILADNSLLFASTRVNMTEEIMSYLESNSQLGNF